MAHSTGGVMTDRAGLMARLFILGVSGLLCLAGTCEEPEQNQEVSDTGLPEQQFRRTRIIITEQGVTTAALEADDIEVFNTRDYTVVRDSLRIDFYNRQGEHVSTLTADSGEIWGLYEEVDSLRAEGNVMIVSSDRDAHMETPFIRWIAAEHRVYADSTVRLSTGDITEVGTGFVANDDLSSYTMQNVTVISRGRPDVPE